MGNLVRTCTITQSYVEKYYPWLGILASVEFVICSTINRIKGYSPVQLIFGRDMILRIKYTVDWDLIRQKKQTQTNKDNIRKNRNRVDHDYNDGDKVMLTNHTEYKYETPFKGPFAITLCFTNGMVSLQYGATKNTYNIHRMNSYKSDTNVED